jgi:molecular chaperone GrpE
MPSSPANDEAPAGARSFATEVNSAPEPPSEATTERDELAALRDELARAEDRYRRALADLDNYRKRSAREVDQRVANAREAQLRDWLEAVDSVERAMRLEPGDPGLTAVLEQMEAILARQGVTRVDAIGTRFDPERHEAIAVQSAADAPDQTVLEVARSGFALDNGELLRPAQVVVSRQSVG